MPVLGATALIDSRDGWLGVNGFINKVLGWLRRGYMASALSWHDDPGWWHTWHQHCPGMMTLAWPQHCPGMVNDPDMAPTLSWHDEWPWNDPSTVLAWWPWHDPSTVLAWWMTLAWPQHCPGMMNYLGMAPALSWNDDPGMVPALSWHGEWPWHGPSTVLA